MMKPMNLRIIRAIAAKDVLDVLRNKSMATVLIVPIFVALLYLVMNLAVQQPTRVLAYNPAAVSISDTLRLATPRLVIDETSRPEDVRTRLEDKNSPYSYGLVIPADAVANIKAGRDPGLTLYINANKVREYSEQQRAQASFSSYFQQAASQAPQYANSEVLHADQTQGRDYLDMVHRNGALFAAIALAIVPIGVGIYILPGLLVEEKERKTIRLLLTSPAAALDVVIAKSLVSFFYTMVLSLIVALCFIWSISDFVMLMLFVTLGNLFAAGVGIILGAYFNEIHTVYAWVGMVSLVLMWPIFFVMPFLSDVPIVSQAAYVVPTYYLTKGLLGTASGDLSFDAGLLYAGVLIITTVAAFAYAAWLLRRRTIFA